ncbi:MAG: hypothetical protein JWL61_4601 [Gemmatimonadetes bacterium]|nr:hypothetical protein [Gemmatimonadota bacterium]
MNCTEARSAMLECELADLAPQATGRLARHIGRCSDCRARADAIVARTGTLRTALAARGRPGAERVFRRGRAIGALSIAAGLVVVVALARRAPHAPIAPIPQALQQLSPVTIENAQGRAVTVVERRDTIDVVFHIREPNE